jgi:2,4-dienoyl-CoA reductase-like NADH-dependent reductase (Old Yellow Enzyme family)
MSLLFSPISLRELTLRNRTVVAPMCQYSSRHGLANDWHLVHLGRFAVGGFGLVILEASGVTAEGRISYGDLGIWDDTQVPGLRHVVEFLHQEGAAAGIQLGHAGRKASTPIPWRHGFDETEAEKPAVAFEHWVPIAPSAISHQPGNADYQAPREMTLADIQSAIDAFAAGARRADAAGFDVVEIHAAHGYLINQFLSSASNHRADRYGGSRQNRMRFALEVTEAVRAAWPAQKPLFVRISAIDGVGGWEVEDSQVLATALVGCGTDLIHVSSGGFAQTSLKPAPLYQVPLSKAVRETGAKTIAVGLIDDPRDAEAILERGEADLVAFARTALEDPNWPIHAERILDGTSYELWPIQARDRIRGKDRVLGRLK